LCWNCPWKLITIEISKIWNILIINSNIRVIVYKCYRICKFVKLPNCVGIVPESWFLSSCLKWKILTLIQYIINNDCYRFCKFVKPPNCVGIVPFSCLFESSLRNKSFEFIFLEILCIQKKYNWITLFWGFEVSQVTPICPHKSAVVFQFKVPFDVNELYQSTKRACSFASKSPFFQKKRFFFPVLERKEKEWKKKIK